MPLFSIISSCYNHARFLDAYMEGILSQTRTDWELVVVDDCSRDDSYAILERYAARDPRIRLARNDRNRGVCYTHNRAHDLTRGRYICCIATDDILQPQHLEGALAAFTAHPTAGVVYAESETIDGEGRRTGASWRARVPFERTALLRALLLEENVLSSPGMVLSREAVERSGGTNELVRMNQDYDWHLRLLLKNDCAQNPCRVLYRRHGSNLSKGGAEMERCIRNEALCTARAYLRDWDDLDLLVRVFPEVKAYGAPSADAIPFFLGRVLMEKGCAWSRLAGMLVLHDYLAAPGNLARVEQRYGFVGNDFTQLVRAERAVPGVERWDRDAVRGWFDRLRYRLWKHCGKVLARKYGEGIA